MAGDWIKFEVGTSDKPEVWAIASSLDIDPDAVVGKLLRVWAWFDQHTEEGNAPSVTKMLLDRTVSVNGFCNAMISVGWMHDDDASIHLPNFGRHNGKTAKNRALTAKRVAEHKSKSNAEGNACIVTTALPKEEKRREDKKHPPISPKGVESISAGFARFWEAYPRKRAKGQAEKTWKRIKPNEQLLQTILESVERAKTSDDWQKDGGQYIPYPGTWLSAKGWEDEYSTNDVSQGDWWETAGGVLQRAQELGIEQDDGEPIGLLKERVKREEGRCGITA